MIFCFNFILIFLRVLTSCQNRNSNRKLMTCFMVWGFFHSTADQLQQKNFKIEKMFSLWELFRCWNYICISAFGVATLSRSHSQSPIIRRPSKAINFRMTKSAPKPLRPPATSLATLALCRRISSPAHLPRAALHPFTPPQCLPACF